MTSVAVAEPISVETDRTTTSTTTTSTPHARPKRPSCCSWLPTDPTQLEKAEADFLAPILGQYQQAKIAGLNTIYHLHPTSTQPPIVLLHGFAGGCALWLPCWTPLTQDHTVYAVDLPGFARSDRVTYKGNSAKASIDYFVGAVEKWVAATNLTTPFILVGHSLGGYISTQYTMRNPSKVCHLALADPWGVPKKPKFVEKDLPMRFRIIAGILKVFNPLTPLRAIGPWGPDKFHSVRPDISAKYNDFFSDPHIVPDYIYHCNGGKPAGESAFYHLYQGLIHPKQPLENILVAKFPSTTHLSMLYGSHTWMDKATGSRLVEEMTQDSARTNRVTKYHVVSEAGHNVFSDNPKEFVQFLLSDLEEARKMA